MEEICLNFRSVDKLYVQTLLERAKAIYEKYDFEYLTVSKRIENSPPEGFNRGDTCIHILRSLFGVDWEVSCCYDLNASHACVAISRILIICNRFAN